MANLIRLKQIESGSYLNTAATIGQDFSQSVVDIITGEVAAALPDGVISSSVQIDILQTTNFVGFSSSISNSFGEVYTQLASITGSIETGLSVSVATSFSQSNAIFAQFSSSISSELSASNSNTNIIFNQLSESVNLELSASNTIFTQFSSSISSELSASSANVIDISSSVNSRLSNLESFTSSLDNGFATDAELTTTASQIIDQGEW